MVLVIVSLSRISGRGKGGSNFFTWISDLTSPNTPNKAREEIPSITQKLSFPEVEVIREIEIHLIQPKD
jgi:hypothetical protein